MIVTRKGVVTKKKYKPVAKKVKPVVASVPNEFRIERNIISNPLANIPTLSPNPLLFTPCGRYTEEQMITLQTRHDDFLLPEEMKLLHHFMSLQNEAFTL